MNMCSTQPLRLAALASVAWCVFCLAGSGVGAGDAHRPVASPTQGWPQWRGPHRDGISAERGLLQEWPEAGPKMLWSIDGIGRGFGSPIIVDGTIYVAGDVGQDLVVFALDLAGKVKWQTTNGKAWKKSHPGSRATCCYDDGHLYLMNAHGRLACIKADDGAEVWAVNVLETFGGKNITWGISESVLVDGNAVFVTPIGKTALMAALDKKTGETLWATAPLAGERCTYSSPSLVAVRGRKQLVTCSAQHAFGVDAAGGALLWQHGHAIPGSVVGTSPVFYRGSMYVSNGTKDTGKVYRLVIDGDEPRIAWSNDLGTTYGGNVVCVDGMLLGSRHRTIKGWRYVDVETGEARYSNLDMPSGSVVYADGRFYCLTDRGVISLHKPTAEGLETVGRLEVIQKKTNVWSHPVICGGRLYVRYQDRLFCYDIRR